MLTPTPGGQVDEALLQALDDALVMLQSMGFSPHRKPFEERLAKWETQLRLVRGGRWGARCARLAVPARPLRDWSVRTVPSQ